MAGTVEVPIWLVVLGALALGFAGVRLMLSPALRWYMRRRRRRAVARINTRLQFDLPQFALTKRKVLMDRLVNDPVVVSAVETAAKERGVPVDRLARQVRSYAKDIVPAFSPYFYFRLGYWWVRRFLRFVYQVRVGHTDEAGLSKISPNATVVMILNHRSNIDVYIVTYLASRRSILSFAAGEWSRVWPFKQLIRAQGAYFVRRDSSDPLYRKVLARYVQIATEGGMPQAIFPEGALSRDGRIHEPKLGLLSYTVANFDPDGPYDIVFVPVGTNYDRVAEEANLLSRADGSLMPKGARFVLGSTVRFVLGMLVQWLLGRRQPFGLACANFGTPISLRAWLKGHGIDFRKQSKADRFKWIARLGSELMGAVGSIIPVLPASIVATVFAEADGEALAADEVERRSHALLKASLAAGAHVYLPGHNTNFGFDQALGGLLERGILEEFDGKRYRVATGKQIVIQFYANSIAHLLPDTRLAAE